MAMDDNALEIVPGWDRKRIMLTVHPLIQAELEAKTISPREMMDTMKLILDFEGGPVEGCFEVLNDEYRALFGRVALQGFVTGFQAATGPKD